jgi:hypothetical protein
MNEKETTETTGDEDSGETTGAPREARNETETDVMDRRIAAAETGARKKVGLRARLSGNPISLQ